MSGVEDQEAELYASLLRGEIPDGGVYLAVGIPKGTVSPPEASGLDATSWVRADGRNLPLIPSVYAAWLFALRPLTADQVLDIADDAGVEDPEEFRVVMERAGLLRRVDPATEGEALADLRVVPLGLGMGNDPDQPDIYEVTDARTILKVSGVAHRLWQEWDGQATIGAACAAVAAGIEAESPGTRWTEHGVSSLVPGLLIALMAARLAFLDGPIDHAVLA